MKLEWMVLKWWWWSWNLHYAQWNSRLKSINMVSVCPFHRNIRDFLWVIRINIALLSKPMEKTLKWHLLASEQNAFTNMASKFASTPFNQVKSYANPTELTSLLRYQILRSKAQMLCVGDGKKLLQQRDKWNTLIRHWFSQHMQWLQSVAQSPQSNNNP